MNSGRRGAFTVLLVVLGWFCSYPAAAQQPVGVPDQQARFQRELAGIQAEEVAVLQELFQMNRDLQDLRSQVGVLEHEVLRVQEHLFALRADQDQVHARFTERRRAFAQRLRFYYMEGSLGLVNLLLSARDLGDFLDRLYLIEVIVRADATLLDNLGRLARELSVEATRVARQEADLRAIRDRLRDRQADLETKVQERETRLAGLQSRRGAVEAALGGLEQVWQEQVRPVLQRFGAAFHTLSLRGTELEPDAIQFELTPPRVKVIVSAASLNRFLQREPALAQLQVDLQPGQVSLAGRFSEVPMEIAGEFRLQDATTVRFVPRQVRFFGAPLAPALTQELVGSGALDLDLGAALAGGRLQDLKVEPGRVTVWAGLR